MQSCMIYHKIEKNNHKVKCTAIDVPPDSMHDYYVKCASHVCDGVNSNVDAEVNKLTKSDSQVDPKFNLQLVTYRIIYFNYLFSPAENVVLMTKDLQERKHNC